MERHNARPISLRKGQVLLDGVVVMDNIAATINFDPEVWEGKQLGEQTDSRRWLGYAITGSITRRRSTPWLKDKIAEYIRTGDTPEFTLQGYQNDENSDYFDEHGADLTTCVGTVLTGTLNLTNLDSNGQVVEDVINFGAKNIT